MDDVRTHDMRTEGDPVREVRVGDEVEGFVVDGELGVGGMGVVYSAANATERVAIKVLRPELSHDPESIGRFVREAELVRRIRHPNIVDVRSIGMLEGGQRYMVMDLLEGETLRVRLGRGALPLIEATQVIDETASALAAAHDQGVIHRDLKPDNVFLVAGGVRLLDFGVAKLVRPGGSTKATLATQTGIALGTPWYMSPEQARGRNVDYRTDIYALGVMAYEVLTGVRPFHVLADGGTLAESAGSAPADLVGVIEAMISDEPDQRPTLALVRAAVKRARKGLRGPTSEELAADELAQRKRAASIGDQARTVVDVSGSAAWPSDVATVAMSPDEVAALDDGATSRRTPVPLATTIGVLAPAMRRAPSEPSRASAPSVESSPPLRPSSPPPIPPMRPSAPPAATSPPPPPIPVAPREAPPMPRMTPLPVELSPQVPAGIDTERMRRVDAPAASPSRLLIILVVIAMFAVGVVAALVATR